MKFKIHFVVGIILSFFFIVQGQGQADSLKTIMKEKEAPVYNEEKNRGYQQNINLTFVHHYSDFFRSNEMGTHMNLGYGIKPKISYLEVVVAIAYSRARLQKENEFYDTYNDKWLLISTLGLGFCVPMKSQYGLMELCLSLGPQAMTFVDVKTVWGIYAGVGIKYYFPSPKSNPGIKMGMFAEFRDHTYSLFGGDYLWDEYFISEKKHVARDGIFLLGFVVGFGDFD
jgi:hypothetical protein